MAFVEMPCRRDLLVRIAQLDRLVGVALYDDIIGRVHARYGEHAAADLVYEGRLVERRGLLRMRQ